LVTADRYAHHIIKDVEEVRCGRPNHREGLEGTMEGWLFKKSCIRLPIVQKRGGDG